MTGKELVEGVRAQVLTRIMWGGGGFPRWLWPLLEESVGLWLCFMACAIKNKEWVWIKGVSVRTFSTRLYGKLWEHVAWKYIKKKKWLQWRCNSELIRALTSARICSSLVTIPILDDDIVRMCPSDLIGCDNRGTKGVRLGQLVLR